VEYSHDWEALAEASAAASAWVVCQPHNPVGRAWRADEIARAVTLAREHDLLLIANEVHLPLGLEGALPSVFSDPDVHSVRALGLTSASKAFNIAGLKSATIYAAEPAAAFLAGLEQGYLGRPGILGAIGTVVAYEEGRPWLEALRKRIRESVDAAVEGLAGLPVGIAVSPMDATYLVWARVAAEERRLFAWALEQAHVRVTPGMNFGGREFEDCFRLNAASHPAVLGTAFARIAEVIGSAVGSVDFRVG
jgi:cystathionine beta-lyase